ncbi:hypothetical protein AB0C52_35815 [Streptomyces sp. NPDC048717]|uniref:hypothetical protein n=1 Tax=Streptomyces sp. NPDC048717 TaxID=3154928 RepID=UPI0034334C11
MTMTPITNLEILDEMLPRVRAAAAGDAGHAEWLAERAPWLARRVSESWRPMQDYRPDTGSLAIDLRNAVGNSAIATTAGAVRKALAERPAVPPQDYLTMLGLASLPAWPLPDDDEHDVVVYQRSGTGTGRLWGAIADGDEDETARAIAWARECVTHGGPDMLSGRARGE